jgi:hypothetical protein
MSSTKVGKTYQTRKGKMSESEKYAGYGWIKVKREVPTVVGDKTYVSEEHHVTETEFLVQKVRDLAKEVDRLRVNLRRLRKQEDQRRSYDSRMSQHDADYLPYQEDERD